MLAAAASAGIDLGSVLPLWSGLPFAGILLSIALFPLVAPHFWHAHYPKIAVAWAFVFAIPFVWTYGDAAWLAISHIYLEDYVPFLILLSGLYIVAGGLVITGDLRATPRANTLLLLVGTLIASWVGTTGAAMVLIRPLLRANLHRKYRVHTVVFFIFLVANVGGMLTPLGDPPLFIGFLRGVPFFWTLTMIKEMLVCATVLLVMFYFVDRRLWNKESAEVRAEPEGARAPLRIKGLVNLVFLAGILLAVLLSGMVHLGDVKILGTTRHVQGVLRDVAIVVLAGLSLYFTRRELRRANEFSWGPIREVAYLFFGIFMTIIPVLEILKAGEDGHLAGLVRAVSHPYEYFWVTGILSSFLDNAPTYLTFLTTALGRFYPGMPDAQAIHAMIAERPIFLEAISAGAVFMGANTYIGNAPNFMVKAIAEEAGVKMPSFFGYILFWTLPFMVPALILTTFVLMR